MIMIKDEHLDKVEQTLRAVVAASAVHNWVHEDAENCLALIGLARKGYPGIINPHITPTMKNGWKP